MSESQTKLPRESLFARKVLLVGESLDHTAESTDQEFQDLSIHSPLEQDFSALIVNASTEMAKQITFELTLALPGCSIMYAPTIELATILLRRRKVNLIVSSSLLPDGSFNKLQSALSQLKEPPDLVVVGSQQLQKTTLLTESSYRIAARRKITPAPIPTYSNKPLATPTPKLEDKLRTLGADLRNDLNNPLQEIVAMVFVAKVDSELSAQTSQALEAIDRAAKNMALLVKGLEQKIRVSVKPS